MHHPRRNDDHVGSNPTGWSSLMPSVVNCFSRDYGFTQAENRTPQTRNGRGGSSFRGGAPTAAGIEIVKTTVSVVEQQRQQRKQAEDFLLFMDKRDAPQLAPSPLLTQSAASTVAFTDQTSFSENKKPVPMEKSMPLLPPVPCASSGAVARSSLEKIPRVLSLDVAERKPLNVGPFTTVCTGDDADVIGKPLCVIPPFLKGHSVAIRISLGNSLDSGDAAAPKTFCVGLTTGPRLYQERGMIINFSSSLSDIKHIRPREVASCMPGSRPIPLETVVVSDSQVKFRKERKFWIIWGEGLLFAGLGEKIGSRLIMATDTASADYTFGYGAGATSIKERYSTDEVDRIYVASQGDMGSKLTWARVEVSSSWLNSPDRYSRALGKICGWRTSVPTPPPSEKSQWDTCLHRANEVKLLACIVDSRTCALSSPNENPGASLAELAWWLRFVYKPSSLTDTDGGIGHSIEVEGIGWSSPMQEGFLSSFNCIGRCRWATVRLGVTEKMILTLLEKRRHEFKEKGIFVEFQPSL